MVIKTDGFGFVVDNIIDGDTWEGIIGLEWLETGRLLPINREI